jgi:hypothetical protein
MVRTALIVGSLAVAWSVQLWTWLERPSDDDRAALIERVRAEVEPGDELAYLPGWEQDWALALTEELPSHPQRLGLQDLRRPFERLWVFGRQGAPGWAPAPGFSVRRVVEAGGLVARLYGSDWQVTPRAFPALAACQLSAQRTRCSDASGRVASTELAFDGRFAWGQKVTVKAQRMTLRFQGAPNAQLVGGFGWTGHGRRHARGRASYRWIDSEPSRADVGGRAGLVPFARRANAQGVVELEVQLDGWTDAELGLAAGWVR